MPARLVVMHSAELFPTSKLIRTITSHAIKSSKKALRNGRLSCNKNVVLTADALWFNHDHNYYRQRFGKNARAYAKSIKHAGGRHDTHIGLGLKMENDDASIDQ